MHTVGHERGRTDRKDGAREAAGNAPRCAVALKALTPEAWLGQHVLPTPSLPPLGLTKSLAPDPTLSGPSPRHFCA